MSEVPENHRVKWSDSEFKKLLKEVKNKINIETIANNHKRTIGAIKFKLFRYAIELSEKDQSITLNELCHLTNLNKDELIEGFQKLKYEFPNDSIYDNNNDNNNYNDNDNEKIMKKINQLNNKINFIYMLFSVSIFIYTYNYYYKS